MPLSFDDTLTLSKAGFLPHEIKVFNELVASDGTPQVIDINSQAWQDMIKSRMAWVGHMRHVVGWPDNVIEDKINLWYKLKTGRTPLDFLRAEYKPPKRISDYQKARQARAEEKTRELYDRRRLMR